MSKLILAHSGSIPSTKILRDALVNLGYPKLLVTRNASKPIIFRYGNSEPANCYEILNPPSFIRMTSDKKIFSGYCDNIGISAPIFSKLNKVLPDSFPVLVRSTLTGQGSEGIYPVKTLDELSKIDTNWHWVPYYNLKNEYRVHVVCGEIVKVFRKKFEGESEDGIIIRNNSNSHFSLVNTNKDGEFVKLKLVVSTLVEELTAKFNNYKLFFALDIGWGQNEREYIILEANSAPGLNESTALEYAKRIGPILYENR